MKYLFIACTSIMLCGCSGVYSSHIIGDKPTNIHETQDEWAGTWMHTDGTITVRVQDASNGVLRVGWIENEKDDLICTTANVFLREGGGWTFANFEIPGATNHNRFVWGRILNKHGQMVVWIPDLGEFKSLVKKNIIPGGIDGSDVCLEELTSKHIRLITSKKNRDLFDWDTPMAFIKLMP